MEANKLSWHNKYNINNDTECSCYYCLTYFKGSEIDCFVDDERTAICPNCSIDSVLPEKISQEKLEELHNKYFKGD